MTKLIKYVMAGLAVLGLATANSLWAQEAGPNSVRDIRTQLIGDQLLISLDFTMPLPATPKHWTTKEPARLILDLPGIKNVSGESIYKVNSGGVRNIQLVQTDAQTRIVVSMVAPAGYETELKGNSLVIKMAPFKQTIDSRPKAESVINSAIKAAERISESNHIRDLTFRRTENGAAQITVDLSDGNIPLDVRRVSTGVIIDLQDTEMPAKLLSKRDVNDFATPVTQITTSMSGRQSRIEIAAKGAWQHYAQIVNNQLKVDVRPLSTTELNKLVPHGQEGKRISINFYDADLGMVLRTLAELSGRNVIVDPSLNGRKITVTLDNMPYDQAIDLVLGQTNAGMRLRPDLVIFGARDVLLKRDVDLADELARANDTAPLVTETFQLNYVPALDVEKLIRVAQNESTTNAMQPVTTATPGGGGQAGSAQTTMQLKGLLTTRGVLSIHGTTNKMFVRDTQAVVDQIRDLIREVDVPPKQVLVEARIVEVATDFARNLGMRLNLYDRNMYSVGGTNKLKAAWGYPDSLAPFDLYGATPTPSLTQASSRVMGSSYNLEGSSGLGLMLFNSAATRLLQIELAAAESDTRGKTISSPRVVTQNRKPAKIENIQQTTLIVGIDRTTGIPIYQTFSAPLTLDVTPSITPDNRVNLTMKIAKSTLKNTAAGIPNTETNNLNTTVMVENGGTVVIGGFYREIDSDAQERVPFLGDLPYVGFLFKTTEKVRNKSELLVFITPRVINEALALN